MSLKHLSFAAITAILLGVAGSFVIQEVRAQRECSDDAQCGANTGLRCLSNRCNVPPPIWDGSGGNFPTAGQEVGFDVARDSRVRGNLTVGQGDSGDLRVNALYSRNPAASADNIWIGDGNDDIRILGDLRFGPDVTPGNAVECSVGQVIKRTSEGRGGCGAETGGGGGGGGGGSFDPCARNVYGSVSAASNGEAGGYIGANGQCPATEHICTSEEILHTINCGRMPSPLPSGPLWISGGPPGHTSLSNDCNGWTSSASGGVYGRTWEFNAQGGVGSQTTCSSSLPFACCLD